MTNAGFTVALDAIEQCARVDLPTLAHRLEPVLSTLRNEPAFDPAGVDNVHVAYSAFVGVVHERQRQVDAAIESTARTLLEVVELYRRADGQG